jgi:hypothetical protein
MKKNIYKILCLFFIIALFTISCKGKPAPQAETDVFQSATQEDVDIMVEFLDEAILEAKHGPSSINPFLTLQFKLTFKRIMVFNCQIENNSDIPVNFVLKNVELTYGTRTDHAHNVNFIKNYFLSYKDTETFSERDQLKKENTAKRYVINENTTIQPGSKITGYLVFIERYPQHGEAMLNIPIFKGKDILVTNFEFPYTFNVYN